MTDSGQPSGKQLVLSALRGQATDRVPATVMTWGFDYLWQVADVEPWQLALGSVDMWHHAHMAMYDRHRPDIIWYSGSGAGDKPPSLLSEDSRHWIVRDGNTGEEFSLDKTSLAVQHIGSGRKVCDPVPGIESRADADRVIGSFDGWGGAYLGGLTRLVRDLGDRALVLPNYCTSYISACYTLGFERSMEMMLTDPDLFIYICEKFREGEEARMQEIAGAGCEVVLIADAWASCDIISPAMFERFALPYHASFAAACRKAGLMSILWNEGDVLPILHLEAALDYDAFTFEQPRKSFRVTVADVRAAFGPGRCIMGNLDSEDMLGRNDPVEIAHAVERQFAESGPGEPFILSTGSPLPSRTPPEAVDAALGRARDFRWQQVLSPE